MKSMLTVVLNYCQMCCFGFGRKYLQYFDLTALSLQTYCLHRSPSPVTQHLHP